MVVKNIAEDSDTAYRELGIADHKIIIVDAADVIAVKVNRRTAFGKGADKVAFFVEDGAVGINAADIAVAAVFDNPVGIGKA